MNDIKMKWQVKKHRRGEPCVRPGLNGNEHNNQKTGEYKIRPYMTDERLNFLARRYQANRICFLLDITFEAYLKAPKGWDRLAKHMNDGGGCRMENGEMVANYG